MGQLKNDDRTREQKMDAVLENIEKSGNISASCRKAKVARKNIYEWEDTIPEFAKRLAKAKRIGADGLQDEANRRAFDGVLKPIFHQGVKVATVREYSDTLMIVLLKAHKPEMFKEVRQHIGDKDNPIVHEITSTVIFEDMSEQKTKPDQ